MMHFRGRSGTLDTSGTSGALSTGIRAWLALGAGALQGASLASPLDGQPVGWLQVLGMGVLVVLLNSSTRARQAAWQTALFALAWLCATFWWLFISMHVYGGLAAWQAALGVLTLAAFLALYYTAAGAVYVRWREKFRPSWWVQSLGFAALWTLAELARGQWFTGFPWGAVGYAHGQGLAPWIAPWVGVYGVGAVAAWCAAALPTGRWPALGVVLAGVVWSYFPPPEWVASQAALDVSLLQGNIAQDEKFDPTSGLPDALAWYGGALRASPSTLVVAPETALPVLPQQLPPDYLAGLQQNFAASPTPKAALLGVVLGTPQAGYSNAVMAIVPESVGQSSSPPESQQQEDLPYAYRKHHLVPFGEFIPPLFRWFTELMNIPLGDFERGGVNQASWAWQGQRLAPHICYEDLFGEELAVRFRHPEQAPTMLVNFSNLAWFGDGLANEQHLQIARMRALEFARPIIRATNTGATAVIDHQGHVQARLPFAQRGVLTATVWGRGLRAEDGGWGITPYACWASRWGLLPLWGLCVLVLVISSIFNFYTRRSSVHQVSEKQ